MSNLNSGVVCRCCGSDNTFYVQTLRVANTYAQYTRCADCSYLQVSDPHWIPSVYLSNPITLTDTGLLSRNIAIAPLIACLLFFLNRHNATHLDFGGGYGILVRLLRDNGIRSYWQDDFSPNLFAKGLELPLDLKVDLVSALEVLEHVTSPSSTLEELLSFSDSVLISTELIPGNHVPAPNWTYYGLEHGQHIGFFSYDTLLFLSSTYGLYLYTNHKNLHLLTRRPLPLPFFAIRLLSKMSSSFPGIFRWF